MNVLERKKLKIRCFTVFFNLLSQNSFLKDFRLQARFHAITESYNFDNRRILEAWLLAPGSRFNKFLYRLRFQIPLKDLAAGSLTPGSCEPFLGVLTASAHALAPSKKAQLRLPNTDDNKALLGLQKYVYKRELIPNLLFRQ